jgi:hypothetical protein
MGFFEDIMGHKRHKKQKQKQKPHNNPNTNNFNGAQKGPNSYDHQIAQGRAKNKQSYKKAHKENVNQIALEIFGSKYFCVGETNGMERS